ncbi:MAG: 4-phosphopantetheinyl transferase [Chloroflexi bacterium]|nr:4-phosphopantetheinyl transferase [Chloroflexota bacterium]|tara:strand:- start:8786 stop:9112 length:327 start_codon:yes stop_codon:yes gene_type:complete
MNVGIDLVQISRFKKIPYTGNESFYQKNFSNEEIKYCLKYNEPYKHFAGKFAIKEAVKKSIKEKLNLSDIITFHNKRKPYVKIKKKDLKLEVSVSHDGDYAIAIVISE